MSVPRTNIAKQEPELYKAAILMSRQADAAALDTGLCAQLVELVKIRVSQLNGCAFCLRAHTQDAIAKGETIERISVLPAWRETSYFDEVEREALRLAERVTHIGDAAIHEETAVLTPAQAAAVTWVAITINAFNRIAITSGYTVAPAVWLTARGAGHRR